MRVVSGKFGGLHLEGVPSHLTRPTTDRVKEAVFSMIGPYFQGGTFLDPFAGSGSIGIEAVSRGMAKAWLVDRQYKAFMTIQKNIRKTHHADEFQALKEPAARAFHALSKQKQKFNIVYLDPPYRLERMVKDLGMLANLKLLNPQALVLCETDDQTHLPDVIDNFSFLKRKQYGGTFVSLYRYKG